MTLKRILDALARHEQRATYGAVAGLLGRTPRSIMQGLPRDWRHSWVVNAETGMPTDYPVPKVHPRIAAKSRVIRTDDELRVWLQGID